MGDKVVTSTNEHFQKSIQTARGGMMRNHRRRHILKVDQKAGAHK